MASVADLEAYLGALTANETPPALDITVMKNGVVAYLIAGEIPSMQADWFALQLCPETARARPR